MRLYCIILLFAFTYIKGFAQEKEPHIPRWYVPDFAAVQYAGSIGFFSIGAGYDLFKEKANVDLLFGYVPPAYAGDGAIRTMTLKFTGEVIRLQPNPTTLIHPLTIGTYFNYTFGHEYSSDLPAWYPNGYYWWSEAVRVNVFIGGNVRFITNRLQQGSKVTAYYEIGTNEIKLASYTQNVHALNIWSILHAGIGVRYHFAK
ncbi:hypothetical protein [Chryseosolibacter indicus]|uniref:Outer membrane protein beta-barrel domain-containing protein n=1 Tax=Chryseosolibacter indicus TaxID=2782351 RepID=A0ABS5VXU3_9BACT|nr:hypothetical protein [Chryseosolibacter indicus]MBT1706076.1 hypothetical protein [Chryseosolibacter indicus]